MELIKIETELVSIKDYQMIFDIMYVPSDMDSSCEIYITSDQNSVAIMRFQETGDVDLELASTSKINSENLLALLLEMMEERQDIRSMSYDPEYPGKITATEYCRFIMDDPKRETAEKQTIYNPDFDESVLDLETRMVR